MRPVIARLLLLLPLLSFSTAFGVRVWIQSMEYAAPTGDDPAFHALAVVETARNPNCILAHLFSRCTNPQVEATWQYPNIIHVLLVPVYSLTQDPILTVKILYTITGLFIAFIPVVVYIIATRNLRGVSSAALSSAWYLASSFLVFNNIVYTYVEGSIFELLGMMLLPLIVYYINRPFIAGLLTGLTIISYAATTLVLIALAPYIIAQGLKYLVKFATSYLLLTNIFFIKYLLLIITLITHGISSSLVGSRLAPIEALQLQHPNKALVLLALLPSITLAAVCAIRSRKALLIFTGYALFVLTAAVMWDRALRYTPLFLYMVPILYQREERVERIFAVAALGLAAFVLYNAQFYAVLFQPTQDLIRLDRNTAELYGELAERLAAQNITRAATICQLSSYLLPILQTRGITAYCLVNPAVGVPPTDPLHGPTQALEEALRRGDLTPLSTYFDVLIIEPPRRGAVYNPLQIALYRNLTQILKIEPRSGVYVVWIAKST